MSRLSLSLALTVASTLHASTGFDARPLPSLTQAPAGAKPFEILTAKDSGVNVPNVFNDPRMWGERFRELTLGAVETGVAIADFNRDGMPDIFAISKNGPCALYLQVAPFKFIDIAHPAGVAVDEPGKLSSNTGASIVDINQDGWPDLYLCRYDLPNLLFVNNKDNTFTESAHAYGLDIKDASVHAAWADYDRDGFLDCYLVTNILDFTKSPQGRKDYLFRNNGNGTFTDVTKAAGIWGLTQGHTALWMDVNHDSWPDLYVANDFETPDRLYLNKGNGTFADVVDERLPHVTYFSMGADAGDINNDGLVDFLITDMRDRNHTEFMTGMEEIGRGLWELERVPKLIPQYMWNAVYLNSGTDHFQEAAHITGLDATGWTWSARLGDLDNDGKLDAFITAGMIRNFIDADLVDKQNVAPSLAARAAVWKNTPARNESTMAFHNQGELKFENVSESWGLNKTGVSFGCALADLDGDGRLDLVFSNFNEPPTVVRNLAPSGNRVLIKLAGRAPNLDGIGAEVRVVSDSGEQVRQLFNERGIASSDLAQLHFGLGKDKVIKRLTVSWPGGAVQTLENVAANQLLTIQEPAAPAGQAVSLPPARLHAPADPAALFTEATKGSGIEHSNTLKPFDEFTRQRLLPRRLNGLGPVLASADVNGDGLEDVFVSATAGQTAALYFGLKDGSFALSDGQPWSAPSQADQVGAAFLDVNGDGHPDLLLAIGGVEQNRGDPRLNDQLYLNDGKGHFAAAPEGLLPADGESTASIAAADFDGDGRMEIFVGGRLVPGKYPSTPKSFLYQNRDGKLVDVTDTAAPELRQIGMVTGSRWADIDGDRRADLILTVEWGSLRYFHNAGNGRLEDWTVRAGLDQVTGWWNTVEIADINGDNRPDLIAGNVGLNTKYRASASEPTELIAGDLDGSGRTQLVEAQYENGKLYPLRGRSKLAYAFPWLPKKFTTYKAFAKASIDELFSAERLQRATRLRATELASGVFTQGSDGRFTFKALPNAAQIAPINAFIVADLDGDGFIDLATFGNNFGPEPTTGRFDGGMGLFLKGDGKGGWKALTPSKSGIKVLGDARSAIAVRTAASATPVIVVATCDGPVQVFTRVKKP